MSGVDDESFNNNVARPKARNRIYNCSKLRGQRCELHGVYYAGFISHSRSMAVCPLLRLCFFLKTDPCSLMLVVLPCPVPCRAAFLRCRRGTYADASAAVQ